MKKNYGLGGTVGVAQDFGLGGTVGVAQDFGLGGTVGVAQDFVLTFKSDFSVNEMARFVVMTSAKTTNKERILLKFFITTPLMNVKISAEVNFRLKLMNSN